MKGEDAGAGTARLFRSFTGTLDHEDRTVTYQATVYQVSPALNNHDYVAHITMHNARDDGREANVLRLCHLGEDMGVSVGINPTGTGTPLVLRNENSDGTAELFYPCHNSREELDSMAGICASIVSSGRPGFTPTDELRPLVVRQVLQMLGYELAAQA